MTISGCIIVCIVVAVCSAFISWAVTYAVMSMSKHTNCDHNFTEVLRIDAPGVHKVAYLCEKCDKVKKVYL